MIRIFIALVISTSAIAGFGGLRHATTRLQTEAARMSRTLRIQTQRLADARITLTKTEQRTRALNRDVRARSRDARAQNANPLLALMGATKLSPAQSEQLLAELGFNWNTSPDFVIVSKSTLHQISVTGVGKKKLTDTACAVLAITDGERSAIDAAAAAAEEQYAAWAASHVQREQPGGDVLAKYSLPADTDFSAGLNQQFTNSVISTLGEERGQLLLDYSETWMRNNDLNDNQGATLTVTRQNNDSLGVEIKQGNGSTSSTCASPYQAFPAQFQPIFPNGWQQLAQQEGFALPKEFNRQQ